MAKAPKQPSAPMTSKFMLLDAPPVYGVIPAVDDGELGAKLASNDGL